MGIRFWLIKSCERSSYATRSLLAQATQACTGPVFILRRANNVGPFIFTSLPAEKSVIFRIAQHKSTIARDKVFAGDNIGL